MLKSAVTLIICLLICSVASGYQIPEQPNTFCESLNKLSKKEDSFYVVQGSVINHFVNGFEFKISELFNSNNAFKDSINIHLNPGKPAPEVLYDTINPNDQIILVVQNVAQSQFNNDSLDLKQEFFIPNDGMFILKVNEGKVVGEFSQDYKELLVREFRSYIKNGDYSEDCPTTINPGVEKSIVRLTHFFITLIAILILLNIWWVYYNARIQKFDLKTRDYGVIALAIALGIWSLISFIVYLNPNISNETTTFLSIVNNGVFLIAVTYFDHGIKWLSSKSKKRGLIISIALLTLIIYFSSLLMHDISLEIELGYSISMLIILMGALFYSFYARSLYMIAFISLLVICVVIVGQIIAIFELGDQGNYYFLDEVTFLSSYSLLSTLIISLAFSWIIEKSTLIPYSEKIYAEIKDKEFIEGLKNIYPQSTDKLKEELRKSIVDRNNTEKILTVLISIFKEKGKIDKINASIIQSSKFHTWKLNKNTNTVSEEESELQISKIQKSTLELIEDIE